jgi:hypothetical protein
MVVGQELTQRRKVAKNAEKERMIGIPAIGWEAFFSSTPLRLSALA